VNFSRAERVMHVHWTLNQVLIKILCWLQEIQPFKCSVTSPTGPLSLRMPSFCIGLARRATNTWQKSRREQATRRPSRQQNQPNEECMRSTHPRKRQRLVVMHGTTATIRPRHASRNFAAITKFLTRKLKISQILSVSRHFCALKIWSYTVYLRCFALKYEKQYCGPTCLNPCIPPPTHTQEIEAIKARVKEMEEEAEKLKEMQGEVEKQMMSAKSGMYFVLILANSIIQKSPAVPPLQVLLSFLQWRKRWKWTQDPSMLEMWVCICEWRHLLSSVCIC